MQHLLTIFFRFSNSYRYQIVKYSIQSFGNKMIFRRTIDVTLGFCLRHQRRGRGETISIPAFHSLVSFVCLFVQINKCFKRAWKWDFLTFEEEMMTIRKIDQPTERAWHKRGNKEKNTYACKCTNYGAYYI